jgi:two-component system sensor histidine kinase RpfC
MLESAGAKLGRFACFDDLRPWLATAAQDRVRRPIVFIDEARSNEPPEFDAARLLDSETGYAARLVLVQNENSAALTDVQRVLFTTEIRRPITDADVAAAFAIASGGGKRSTSTGVTGAALSGPGLHVLVAEDNRTNQKVIAKVLERAGHRVRLVDNGQEALDALAERPFDIVLMDVNMPVLNGIEATRRYRAASVGQQHVPILALTADATAEASARCAEAGMDGCLTKPIEPAKLIELVGDFCSQGPRADVAEVEPAADVVADLDQGGAAAAIDAEALSALEKLGGRDFVKEIVLQFVGDAATVLRGLSAAVANGDLELFRDRAHALRSCAANVGAQTVYKLCLSWRELEAQEFALHGAEYMEKLEKEFEQARAALEAYLN